MLASSIVGIICGGLELFVPVMNLKGFFASVGRLGVQTVHDKCKLNSLLELLGYHGMSI